MAGNYEYGCGCRMRLAELKELWADGIISMREFSDGVAKAVREDDGIPF